jgi:hypothetical protein
MKRGAMLDGAMLDGAMFDGAMLNGAKDAIMCALCNNPECITVFINSAYRHFAVK